MRRIKQVLLVVFLVGLYLLPVTVVASEKNQEVMIKPLYRQLPIGVLAGEQDPAIKTVFLVNGKDVYVDCLIRGVELKQEKAGATHHEGEGHYRLYLNDQHIDTLFQPSFVIEGLASGEHTIKVELVKNDRSSYDSEDVFNVTIP
ncbi:hypothetical protein [Bacillus sp. FJAT-45037]|uniref:hypothetical protein n=1 Tax=Bacillus sp. FJAT-45037 TaxID=2011007 RepID=UPI000C2514A1|nr:hypothetical protein [Bacillus sp. FJAT-45037]